MKVVCRAKQDYTKVAKGEDKGEKKNSKILIQEKKDFIHSIFIAYFSRNRNSDLVSQYHMDLHDIQSNQSGYIRENAAYRRLPSQGLCDKGYTPRFYGSIEDVDTELCGP